MLLILIFLLRRTWKTTLLFSAVSIVLVLSHQATTFLTIMTLSILAVGLYVSKGNKEQNVNSNKSNILLIGILSVIAALYFGVYAAPAIILTLTPSDALNLGAYVIVITAAIVYVVGRPIKSTPARTTAKCAVSFLAPAIIVFLLTRIPVLPGAPTLPFHYFIYAMPFLIATPLMVFGLNDLHKSNFALITPVFWLTAILTLAIYTFFSNLPGASGFIYRFLNFMLPPMMILTAIALHKLYSANPRHLKMRKISKLSAAALIIIITVT